MKNKSQKAHERREIKEEEKIIKIAKKMQKDDRRQIAKAKRKK